MGGKRVTTVGVVALLAMVFSVLAVSSAQRAGAASTVACGAATKLTTNTNQREWLPTWDTRAGSQLIAFARGPITGSVPNDLGGVNADGTGERTLASGATAPWGITWEPNFFGADGLLVMHERNSIHENLEFDVDAAPFHRSTFNGSQGSTRVVNVINGGGGGGWYTVSRDGSTALWRYSTSGGGGTQSIRTAAHATQNGGSANSATVLRSTFHRTTQFWTQMPGISPDGSTFVLTESFTGGEDLYLYSTSTGALIRKLTTDGESAGAYNRQAEFSPDGTMIAFARATGGQWDLYTMNIDGTGLTQVSNSVDFHEQAPTWSPDATKLAFHATVDGDTAVYLCAPGVPPTPTATEVPPTPTATEVPPEPTPTATEVPPTPTATEVPPEPTPTATEVPVEPTPTATEIQVEPTPTATEVPPESTPTATPVPESTPTSTPEPEPSVDPTPTATSTPEPAPSAEPSPSEDDSPADPAPAPVSPVAPLVVNDELAFVGGDFSIAGPYKCGVGFAGEVTGGESPYELRYTIMGEAEQFELGVIVTSGPWFRSPPGYIDFDTVPAGTYTVMVDVKDSIHDRLDMPFQFSAYLSPDCSEPPEEPAEAVQSSPAEVLGVSQVAGAAVAVAPSIGSEQIELTAGIVNVSAPVGSAPALAFTGSTTSSAALGVLLLGSGTLLVGSLRRRHASARVK